MIFHVSKRFAKELFRMPISAAIMLGMPAFMGFMFFFAFSSAGLGEAQTYNIGIINEDIGIESDLSDYLKLARSMGFDIGINDSTLAHGFATDFIKILNTTNYPTENDNELRVKIFNVMTIENETIGRKKVENREIDGLMIIDEAYSNTILSAINQAFKVENGFFIDDPVYYTGPAFPKEYNASIEIIGDENYANFMVTKAILTSFLSGFVEQLQSFGYQGGNINFDIHSLVIEDYSVFDTIMPGILIFAVLTQSGMIASFLVAEFAETKTIARIKLSLIKPYEYILGVTILMFFITLLQVIILLGFSIFFFGFNPTGDILQSIIIILLTTFFIAALGFLIASIFKSSDTAGMSSGFLMTPLAFMSGAFMEVPPITLIPVAFPTPSGLLRDFVIWDLLPITHAVNALRSVLLYNFMLVDVLADLLFLTIPSLLLLIIGIVIYTKSRFMGDIV